MTARSGACAAPGCAGAGRRRARGPPGPGHSSGTPRTSVAPVQGPEQPRELAAAAQAQQPAVLQGPVHGVLDQLQRLRVDGAGGLGGQADGGVRQEAGGADQDQPGRCRGASPLRRRSAAARSPLLPRRLGMGSSGSSFALGLVLRVLQQGGGLAGEEGLEAALMTAARGLPPCPCPRRIRGGRARRNPAECPRTASVQESGELFRSSITAAPGSSPDRSAGGRPSSG